MEESCERLQTTQDEQRHCQQPWLILVDDCSSYLSWFDRCQSADTTLMKTKQKKKAKQKSTFSVWAADLQFYNTYLKKSISGIKIQMNMTTSQVKTWSKLSSSPTGFKYVQYHRQIAKPEIPQHLQKHLYKLSLKTWYLITAVHTGHSFRQPNHAFQLSHCDSPGRLCHSRAITLPQPFILLHYKVLRLLRYLCEIRQYDSLPC